MNTQDQMPQLSVVICTHNPRKDYLARALDALRGQTMPYTQWELLVIDNRCDIPLDGQIDLAWHPHKRCVREEQLGLAAARVRGMVESLADLIVFVDDDNVLDQDYLERTLEIAGAWPKLGAWGGIIYPEFESPPPEWVREYWGCLGNRSFDKDMWGCASQPNETVPYGAGMAIRRSVADAYLESLRGGKSKLQLGRKGNQLQSCEDTDLALTSWTCGLGTGSFVALRVTHLIPPSRVTRDYLRRMIEGAAYSGVMFTARRGLPIPQSNVYNTVYHFLRGLRRHGFDRTAYYARQHGIERALRDLRSGSKR